MSSKFYSNFEIFIEISKFSQNFTKTSKFHKKFPNLQRIFIILQTFKKKIEIFNKSPKIKIKSQKF